MESHGAKKPYIEKVHFQVRNDLIDLRIGAPGPDLLAKSKEVIRLGAQSRLALTGDEDLFNYGPEEGPTSFLYNLSQLLSDGYQVEHAAPHRC